MDAYSHISSAPSISHISLKEIELHLLHKPMNRAQKLRNQ